MTRDPDRDIELGALLDGALDSGEARALQSRLATDAALAARYEALRTDKAMLKDIYGPLSARPLPKEWLARIEAGKKRKPLLPWHLAGAIAAVLVLALAGIATYRVMAPAAPAGIVEAALTARAKPDGDAIAVNDVGEAGRYRAAISAAIAVPVKVPDLGRMGYRLTTIRLHPQNQGRGAAELIYRDGAGRLFTLYLRHSDGNAHFDQFKQAGLRVCLWQDDQLGMVMAGNVSTAAMQRLASLAYTGLTL